MDYKILLIEDDSQIREIIVDSFNEKGAGKTRVETAIDGLDGLEKAMNGEFNLIILDIMLPGIDGFSIMRSIRSKKDVPVIFLTARTREEDVLYGYELGCDDYVTKPFSPSTLFAKSIALINRDLHTVTSKVIACGTISIDTRTFSVTVANEKIELPPIEYRLLCYLMNHKDWVIDRDTLLNAIWGTEYNGGTRVVDNHIKNLRHLLKCGGKQIKTVISKGYKITEN